MAPVAYHRGHRNDVNGGTKNEGRVLGGEWNDARGGTQRQSQGNTSGE